MNQKTDITVKHTIEDYIIYPKLFLETFCFIKPKLGPKVPFIFNNLQAEYYEILMQNYWKKFRLPDGTVGNRFQGIREVNLKARQWGLSTLISGLYYHQTITNLGTDTKIYCQDEDYSKKMLSKYQFLYDHQLDDIYKPESGIYNTTEIEFPGLYSSITYGTPGASKSVQRKQGRSTTIFNLHLSEFAEFPDARATMQGLEESVPEEGNILIESSPNKIGDYFHVMYNKAKENDSEWTSRFWEWFRFEEYKRKITDSEKAYLASTITQKELFLIEKFNLSLEQIAWRRMKISKKLGDEFSFLKEHPEDDEECFEAEAQMVFTKEERKKTCLKRDYAIPGHIHAIGADVALGITGGDYSSIVVIDVVTMEQIYEWHGHCPPQNFAKMIYDVWLQFPGLVGIEANSFGHTTVIEAFKIIDWLTPAPGFLFSNNRNPGGWFTSEKTKSPSIFELKQAISDQNENQRLKISSDHILREMGWFQHFEGIKMGAPSSEFQSGQKLTDDSVMALSIANGIIKYIWQIEKIFTKRFGKPNFENEPKERKIIIPVGIVGKIKNEQ